jgi:hypothetical protein
MFFDGNGDPDLILVNPFHGGGLTFHPDYDGGVTDPVDQFFVDFVDLDDTDLLSVNYDDMDFKLDDYAFSAQVLDVSDSSVVSEQIDFFDIDDDGTIDWAYHFDGTDYEAAEVTINDSYQAESMTLTYIDNSTSLFDLAVIANHHVVGLYFDA